MRVSRRSMFAQAANQFCVGTPCAARVQSGVKIRRRFKLSMAQKLTYKLVGAGICIENDLGGQVPELMR